MYKLRRYCSIFIATFSLIIATGCEGVAGLSLNGLSSSTALALLQAEKSADKTQPLAVGNSFEHPRNTPNYFSFDGHIHDALKAEGILYVDENKTRVLRGSRYPYLVWDNRVKEYIRYERVERRAGLEIAHFRITLCKMKPGGVLNMKPIPFLGDNGVLVEYQYEVEFTPIGNALRKHGIHSVWTAICTERENGTYSQVFIKSANGWVIQR